MKSGDHIWVWIGGRIVDGTIEATNMGLPYDIRVRLNSQKEGYEHFRLPASDIFRDRDDLILREINRSENGIKTLEERIVKERAHLEYLREVLHEPI